MVLDRSSVIESLDRQLLDDRDPARVQHSLSSQLRTLLVQRALGWDDLSDTQTLANDPVLQLACSDQRSTTPIRAAPSFAANPVASSESVGHRYQPVCIS